MSKPVYEIPVTGGDDESSFNFPPPAPAARPAGYTQAPPPSVDGAVPAPSWPAYSATPAAPYTSPAPTEDPAGWGAPAAPLLPPPVAGTSVPSPEPSFPPPTASAPSFPPPVASVPVFPPPVASAPSFPPPASPAFPPPAPETITSAPAAPVFEIPEVDPAFAAVPLAPVFDLTPEPEPAHAADLDFAPPTPPEDLSYAEQLFASEGVSETLGTADPDLIEALSEVLRIGASDLHIAVNATPMLRVDGALGPGSITEVWGKNKVNSALRSLLLPEQEAKFDENLEYDFAYTISANARFRVNLYQQRGSLGAAFRLIPTEIKPLDALGVPASVAQFATLPRGLVLVTGPTGSGKSTTLAALIDLVNRTRADHVMTVEDPIEFLHGNKKSLVNQREVGHDTHSFGAALKHVLRQDPDVILIGELRDLETISVALTAAETGHLVFATLHTQSASQTIDRIIDVFPPHQQGQVRSQLAATIQGVVCQTLVKKASGRGRMVATEIMIATPAIGNLIREGKTYQIPSAMQAGGELGMHTMDRHLADLVNSGEITLQTAIDKAQDLEGLKQMVHRQATPTNSTRSGSSSIDFGDAHSGATL
ncbi:type IV pilus twitching motility protein PilT [Galbitalea soli]|uniref:PilT/PilU family type 4a pilus ATPase n=1 Tax=Galbitalea soli TaxID=1268042 RepID=A0A7C9TQ55_9MICO|nr:type IV pilus twitching motility protein PilT [Galbitalea soli]NEM91196.1 PilT/PilU family type 4a pilus ATPase [Galbitalea soli]NYJ29885.1 twitching motility protein PilT [Galbitalea soli]